MQTKLMGRKGADAASLRRAEGGSDRQQSLVNDGQWPWGHKIRPNRRRFDHAAHIASESRPAGQIDFMRESGVKWRRKCKPWT